MASKTVKAFTIGTRAVHFAALTFRQLDALKDEIDLIMAPLGANFAKAEARDAIVKIASASLAHETPAITDDFLRDNLDTFNFPLIVSGIFERNGFLADGAESEQGEAGAAASTS